MIARFVSIGLAMLAMQCHAQEPVAPPAPSTPDAEVVADAAPQDSGAPSTASSAAADVAPAPTAQDLCVDSGQRVRFTVTVQNCGLKLGKTSTDEQRPGVVRISFSMKGACKDSKPVNVELMSTPLQQRRFQLIVEDDAGHTYADQMVTTTSLPACKR